MKNIKGFYKTLSSQRLSYLNRARQYARYTIPYLIRQSDEIRSTKNDSGQLELKFDSVGAEAVVSLANKIVQSLFPTRRPYYTVKPKKESEMAEELARDKQLALNTKSAINKLNMDAMELFNSSDIRNVLVRAATILVVAGDALYIDDTEQSSFEHKHRVYDLNDYVIKRDINGNVLKIIVREVILFGAVPQEVKDKLGTTICAKKEETDELELYTHVARTDGENFEVTQEMEDVVITESPIKYTKDNLPYIPLSWNVISGEDYGRGLVETHLGAFKSVHNLSKAQALLSVAASRVTPLVKPGSQLSHKIVELNNAPSGTYFEGLKDDISYPETNKLSDAQLTQAQIDNHSSLIARVFLMSTSIQRDAERVTAEEIRKMAEALESNFGGIYSQLSYIWQKPLAVRQFKRSLEANGLADLEDTLDVLIVSGLDGLTQSSKLDDLYGFLTALAKIAQELGLPLAQLVDTRALLEEFAELYNIDTISGTSIIKSDKQQQEDQQAAQQAAQQQAVMETE